MKHASIAFFIPHLGCPHTCAFCNQREISGVSHIPTSEEIKEICLRETAALGGKNRTRRVTIAFFGGSFTAVDRALMLRLLGDAYEFVRAGLVDGIRISTRPDAIDREVLEILRAHGVTNIELGAQSLDDGVLGASLRGHTADDVRRAAELVKEFGFSLGLQMMLGLPGDTEQKALATARSITALAPREVRIYPTVVLPGTKLADMYTHGQYNPPDLDRAVELTAKILPIFRRAGIDVIKVGLHAEKGVEQNRLAGAYHPAFRELCESRMMFDDILRRLDKNPRENRLLTLGIRPQNRSKLVGQKKANLTKFAALGYDVKIVEGPGFPENFAEIL